MKIDQITENDFIEVYREFLLDFDKSSETENVHRKLTEKVVIGRRHFSGNRDLLKVFLEKKNKVNFPKKIISFIENIEIAKWIYLLDTRDYSVILNIDGLSGYGGLGLNDKIKEIVWSVRSSHRNRSHATEMEFCFRRPGTFLSGPRPKLQKKIQRQIQETERNKEVQSKSIKSIKRKESNSL